MATYLDCAECGVEVWIAPDLRAADGIPRCSRHLVGHMTVGEARIEAERAAGSLPLNGRRRRGGRGRRTKGPR
jgi:hypothetical protein